MCESFRALPGQDLAPCSCLSAVVPASLCHRGQSWSQEVGTNLGKLTVLSLGKWHGGEERLGPFLQAYLLGDSPSRGGETDWGRLERWEVVPRQGRCWLSESCPCPRMNVGPVGLNPSSAASSPALAPNALPGARAAGVGISSHTSLSCRRVIHQQ